MSAQRLSAVPPGSCQFLSPSTKNDKLKRDLDSEVKSQPFIHASEMKWENAGEGVRRQILGYSPEIMMVRVDFDKGAIGPGHTHPHCQVTYVESGRFEVESNGKKEELVAGDCFIVDPDVRHAVRAVDAGCLIDVFTPLREDFLVGKE